MKAIDFVRVRSSCRPATPSAPAGGHLYPTMLQALGLHIKALPVEEGIADGISQVGKAVPYQIEHGASSSRSAPRAG